MMDDEKDEAGGGSKGKKKGKASGKPGGKLGGKLSALLGGFKEKLGGLGRLLRKPKELGEKLHMPEHLGQTISEKLHLPENLAEKMHLPEGFEEKLHHFQEEAGHALHDKRKMVILGGVLLLAGFGVGIGIWLHGGSGDGGSPPERMTPALSLPMPPRIGPGETALVAPPSPSATPAPGPAADAPLPNIGQLLRAASNESRPQESGQPGPPVEPAPSSSAPGPATPPAASAPAPGAAGAAPGATPGAPAALPPMTPLNLGQAPAAEPSPAASAILREAAEAALSQAPGGQRVTSASPVKGEPRQPGVIANPPPTPNYLHLPTPAPQNPPPPPMPEAPQPLLQAKLASGGSIPVIGPDGKQAWTAYAKPFPADDKRARLAVVIMDIGLSKDSTEAGISRFPGEVTLSVNPYSDKPDEQAKRARAAGHEILITLPMEPPGFPARDPGPLAQLSGLPQMENQRRLELTMSKMTGYVGVAALQGKRFLTNTIQTESMLRSLKTSGLLFLDHGLVPGSAAERLAKAHGLPYAKADVWIDDRHFRAAIDVRLRKVEDDAITNGRAVLMVVPRPLTLERLSAWLKDLPGKNIALAPLSAVVAKGMAEPPPGAAPPGAAPPAATPPAKP
jgi:polysaccharide deacetylase 2 family uncharacterized protein YibQ